MQYYTLNKTTNYSDLSKRDLTYINNAISSAETSPFHSSLRLGACIILKGYCILRG